MIRVLVSACLLGEKVRYNGSDAISSDAILTKWIAEGRVVPFCPELAGGLGVPRPAAEINGSGGEAVLDRQAHVCTQAGIDVTDSFLEGAHLALATAQAHGIRVAVLKDGSPSCGSLSIYDGTFTGRRKSAPGVTTALLERNGIRVFSEQGFEDAARHVNLLEQDLR